jgi:predicted amidophosphoribosyltransferase
LISIFALFLAIYGFKNIMDPKKYNPNIDPLTGKVYFFDKGKESTELSVNSSKICFSCGSTLGIDDIFCVKCGKNIDEHRLIVQEEEPITTSTTSPVDLSKICPNCLSNLKNDEKFCANCGKKVLKDQIQYWKL